MRKNQQIDYTQIGLQFILQTQDIVMNAGLCTVLLGNLDQAKIHFKKGYQISDENSKQIIKAQLVDRKQFKRAIDLGNEAPNRIHMKYSPLSLIFVPQSEPADLADFLGVSKVVSGTTQDSPCSSEDQSSDFIFDYISEKDASSGFLSRNGTKNISLKAHTNKLQTNNLEETAPVSDFAITQRFTMYSTGSTISTGYIIYN